MEQTTPDVPPAVKDPDGPLIERARKSRTGDLRAFEELVNKYQRRVIANCRHLTAHADAADDLAQEVFVKIYFGLRSFEGRSTFRHWMQSIKVRHCLTYLKKESGKKVLPLDDEAVQQSPQMATPAIAEQVLEGESDRELVAAVLGQMTETLRVPLILCDMDELSYDAIAEALGIGLSAVKMRIQRARQDFRARYRVALQRRQEPRGQYA